jgi:hypothetical protein
LEHLLYHSTLHHYRMDTPHNTYMHFCAQCDLIQVVSTPDIAHIIYMYSFETRFSLAVGILDCKNILGQENKVLIPIILSFKTGFRGICEPNLQNI